MSFKDDVPNFDNVEINDESFDLSGVTVNFTNSGHNLGNYLENIIRESSNEIFFEILCANPEYLVVLEGIPDKLYCLLLEELEDEIEEYIPLKKLYELISSVEFADTIDLISPIKFAELLDEYPVLINELDEIEQEVICTDMPAYVGYIVDSDLPEVSDSRVKLSILNENNSEIVVKGKSISPDKKLMA